MEILKHGKVVIDNEEVVLIDSFACKGTRDELHDYVQSRYGKGALAKAQREAWQVAIDWAAWHPRDLDDWVDQAEAELNRRYPEAKHG